MRLEHRPDLRFFIPCCCLLLLIVTSCAIKQQPSGGKKDTTPPKILKSSPANFSTNFSTKEIKIDFDEYIDLRDLNKQLVISPLMPVTPDISVKNKSLLIKLPDSLKQNITYTLNFGNAIVDTHESNAIDDFQYVFATGAVLDSLQLKGEVKFSENLKTEKGIVVMLYENTSDTIVYHNPPDYFARTDSSGNFVIKNLHSGRYKLFALKDANNNYEFDSKTEAIGFSDETVDVPDTVEHHLRLFIEPDTVPHVLKAQFVSAGKALFVFTAPVNNFRFSPFHSAHLNNLLFEKSLKNDSVFVYSADSTIDSLNAVIYNGNAVIDTIHVNIKPKVNNEKGEARSQVQILTSLAGDVLESPYNLTIAFSAPLKSLDSSQLVLKADSTKRLDFTLTVLDLLKKKFHINFKAGENKSYSLLIPSNTVTDIFNHKNDSVKIEFRTRAEKEYATLILNFTVAKNDFNYIVQLLTDDDRPVKELTIDKNQKLTFGHILPGSYKIRIIDDENKNGKWDGGNYVHHVQPEKVFYYPENITTRANWDLDLKWNLK